MRWRLVRGTAPREWSYLFWPLSRVRTVRESPLVGGLQYFLIHPGLH